MLDLTPTSLDAWFSTRPQDVRETIGMGQPACHGDATSIVEVLMDASPLDVPQLVREHSDGARALGRLGRTRLMAWLADNGGPNPGTVFRRLVGTDDEGDDSGSDEVGLLFLEDIRALNDEIVAQRISRLTIDQDSLIMAATAAVTLESDMALRQGGV